MIKVRQCILNVSILFLGNIWVITDQFKRITNESTNQDVLLWQIENALQSFQQFIIDLSQRS